MVEKKGGGIRIKGVGRVISYNTKGALDMTVYLFYLNFLGVRLSYILLQIKRIKRVTVLNINTRYCILNDIIHF
jgi:hypothetical protein